MGSTPTLVTDEHDPVVQRSRRLADIQESAGSIPAGITFDNRSVSVVAARRCGKAEDRVQFPDGPLDRMGCSFNGRTLGLHPGNRGSTPRRSTMNRRRKTAGKRRRKVRCTICNAFRWMGNAKGRFKEKDEREMRDRQRLNEYE